MTRFLLLIISCPLWAVNLLHDGGSATYPETCAGVQSALNATVGGDIVELTGGVLYSCGTTTITIPVHSGTAPVLVRTSNFRNLPDGRTRICPAGSTAQAGVITYPCIANIVSSGGVADSAGGDLAILQWDNPFAFGITSAASAADWTLLGLELRGTSTVGWSTLIDLYITGPIADRTQRIMIDRCWLHGYYNSQGPQKILRADGQAITIKNSILEEFKAHGADGQGVAILSGPGPVLVENNFIAGGAENLMAGGGTTAQRGSMPSFLHFIGNYSTRDVRWWRVTSSDTTLPTGSCTSGRYYRAGATDWWQCQAGAWVDIDDASGPPLDVYDDLKNLFEFKGMRGSIIESNRFDNYWTFSGQMSPILFNLDNGQNGYTYGVADVQVRYNTISNTSGIFTIGAQTIRGVSVTHNLIDSVTYERSNASTVGGGSTLREWSLSGTSLDNGLLIRHNTEVRGVNDPHVYHFKFYGAHTGDAHPYFQILDNISGWGYNPITADGGPSATQVFSTTYIYRFAPRGRATGNVFYVNGATVSSVYRTALTSVASPDCCTGNWVSSLDSDILVNPGTDNQVRSDGAACDGAPCVGKATDGTDPGVDIATLESLTVGATSGVANDYLQFRLGSWSATNTGVTIHYQAPSTSTCTAALSTSETMSPTVGSIAQSGSGLARTAIVTGLDTKTHYWYTVVCGAATRKTELWTH